MAELVDHFNSPDKPPYKGETHAYLNLQTGEPIRCADGELLTYTPPPGTTEYAKARCADGSVPPVYKRQRRALEAFVQQAPFGTPVDRGPRFAFEYESGE